MDQDWSISEVHAIVESYFRMLDLECRGMPFVKAEERRMLEGKLRNRSNGAVEFKFCNISAVLAKSGLPYIWGYKPRGNYQRLLEEAVLTYVGKNAALQKAFESFVEGAGVQYPKNTIDFSKLLEPSSPSPTLAQEEVVEYRPQILSHPNYLEREQQNRHLGNLGEQLVFEYEQWRLRTAGRDRFADQVEWIARDKGDGAGFDILSRNDNGTDRFIEVKTTKLGEFIPIYLTRNELLFSQQHSDQFYLYRVYNFYRSPRMFIKQGAFDAICRLEPTGFMGRFE